MELTTFSSLEEHKARVAHETRVAQEMLHTAEQERTRSGERFTLSVLLIAGLLLLVIAFLFDYLVALNVLMARVALWIAVGVIFVALSRAMHRWVFAPMRHITAVRAYYAHVRRQSVAMSKYMKGDIDAEGIRMVYQDAPKPRDVHTHGLISEWLDWLLYTGLALAIVIFALIFV